MRLIFNLFNVGLGNNGGSRTILLCAETLASLGYDVIIFSNIQSRYTWHNPVGPVFVYGDKIPKGDVIVATGYKSVKSTVNSNIQKKYYYIRGYENWQANDSDLLSSYRSLNCIVNSSWLYDFLKSKNIHSEIIYPGLDFDCFFNKNKKRDNIIGALYSKKHKTKRYDDIIKIMKNTSYKVVVLNKDISDVDSNKLNLWYNKIKIWFAPTESEGLHNPPMEACLSGCVLVSTDHPRSGMSDYSVHNKTSLIYPARNISKARECIDSLIKDDNLIDRLNNNMCNLLRSKIGDRKSNMTKFVDYIRG